MQQVQQPTRHVLVVSYERDLDSVGVRSRVRECAACGMPWPCPAEIGRAIIAAMERE